MDSDHFMRRALRRLLLGVAAALAVSGAAAQAAGAFSATAGVAVSGPVGTFTTSCLGTNCAALNPFVNIDWGDGGALSRVAAVPACPVGCASSDWTVSAPDGTTPGPQDAPHTYARPGSFPASFTGVLSGTVSMPATVTDDPSSIAESAVAVRPVVGSTFSGAVATFTDTNPLVQPAEFTATVNWGDGQTTTGTVSQSLGQPFRVSGSHVYAHVGSFPVTVAVQHVAATADVTGASAQATGTASVTDAALTGAADVVSAVAGVPFSGTVATFADPNPFARATDFTATITWGSEATTAGTVAATPGGFAITGSHTFAGSGAIALNVLVVDRGGSRATISGTAQVRPAPPPPVTSAVLAPAAPNGRHGWYRSPVHVVTAAAVTAGAVSQTRCALDAAVPDAFDALPPRCPFAGAGSTVSGDGRHVLYAASISDAGQRERPGATTIAIDTTAPRLSCLHRAPAFVQGSSGASITAMVRDATSGPASQTVSVRADVSVAGARRARLTAFDQAGNSAAIACPYRVLGHISPSMFWSFTPGRTSTIVDVLLANDVPAGATVRVLCRGSGCPTSPRSVRVSPARCGAARCTNSKKRRTATVALGHLFRGRRLHAGAVVTVAMTAHNDIGKAFVFTMRAARQPKVVISCLAPGSDRPGRGC